MSGVVTIPIDEMDVFLHRHRRWSSFEPCGPELEASLRQVLERALQLVPAETVAIYLDDPLAKRSAPERNRLTCLAACGEEAERRVGAQVDSDLDLVGRCYAEGTALADGIGVAAELATPIRLGSACCGVLSLVGRSGQAGAFTAVSRSIAEFLAHFFSCAIQNTMDNMRARDARRRDHLTGLFNECFLHFRMRELVQVACAEQGQLALAILDIDRFARVNERYGHSVGTQALQDVALLLARAVPEDAVLGRFGGDRFVLLLPDTNHQRAVTLTDEVRDALAGTSFIEEPESPRLAVSVGVSALSTAHGRDPILASDALMREAEAALVEDRQRRLAVEPLGEPRVDPRLEA